MIIEQLYDALLEAGASESKAREASRAVADFRETIHQIQLETIRTRTDLTTEIHQLRGEFHELRSTVRLQTWMLGAVFAAVVIPALVKFFH
jgi:hypothetical protein